MAKGYDKHQQRQQAIQGLGRALARRARSACELCERSGRPLHVREVSPPPEVPDADHAVMVCQACGDAIAGGALSPPDAYRFLEAVVWSDLPVVQVCAVRLLRRVAGGGAAWAADTLEGLYLTPDILRWADGH